MGALSGKTEKRVLFVASVLKKHIIQFHIPYLRWFREQGFIVDVCAANDLEDNENIPLDFCDNYYDVPFCRSPFHLKNIAAYHKLKGIISENNYDIIHCHTPTAAAIARIAAADARKKGCRLLYTAHGFHFFKGASPVSRLYYFIEKMLSGMTDAIITINSEDFEASKRLCGGKCDTYLLHGVGVDTKKIAAITDEKSEIRRRLNIPENAFTVMTTAELNRNKNIFTALKAISLCKTENLRYIICGSGELRRECEKYAEKLGIGGITHFLGYRYDVPTLLHAADVFLFPSYREGLGIAAIEAMSAGVPVVGSNIRGITEYAANGVNSILLNPSDAAGFADAIDRLAADGELLRRLGAAAQSSVDKFDISNSVSTMADIYRKYMR